MPNLQLEGEVDTRDEELVDARNKIMDLQHQLERAHMELAHARELSKHAVGKLRHVLNPLYEALKIIYGEMDAISPNGSSSVASTASGSNPKWEMWKKRFAGRGADLIDLLLIHEQMNTKQLSSALKCDPRTLAQVIYKLNQASLIQKNGNMYSLKEI